MLAEGTSRLNQVELFLQDLGGLGGNLEQEKQYAVIGIATNSSAHYFPSSVFGFDTAWSRAGSHLQQRFRRLEERGASRGDIQIEPSRAFSPIHSPFAQGIFQLEKSKNHIEYGMFAARSEKALSKTAVKCDANSSTIFRTSSFRYCM